MGRRPDDPSFDPVDSKGEESCTKCIGETCFCGGYKLITQAAPILFMGFLFGSLVHGFKEG